MARAVLVSLFPWLKKRSKTLPAVEAPHPPEEAEMHVRHHPHAHTYASYPESFGLGSMLLRPDAS